MRLFPRLFILLFIVLVYSCGPKTATDPDAIEREIMAVLDGQVKSWNKGEIEEYMAGYERSDSLRFASGGNASYGWHTTLERYKNGYPDRVAMGLLQFSDIDITVISKDAAFVFGKWELKKVDENPRGLFTLVFRKTEAGWRIVHDHTSSARE